MAGTEKTDSRSLWVTLEPIPSPGQLLCLLLAQRPFFTPKAQQRPSLIKSIFYPIGVLWTSLEEPCS